MTEWIKCSEKNPTERGNLLVIINGEILFAKAMEDSSMMYARRHDIEEIYFLIRYCYETSEKNSNLMFKRPIGGEWIKPKLYADITHWLELPKPPHEE